jgi:hypothetical protein
MNKLSIKAKSFFSCLALLSVAIVAPASWAHDDCTPYTAMIHMEGTSPFGPFNGGATYNIGNQPPQQAQLAAVLKDSASFNPASPVTEITFSSMALFAPGVDGSLNALTGVDRAVGTATGPGTFVSTTKSRITGGAGLYENVTGSAQSTSTSSVNLATGYTVVDINVRGKICGIGQAINN